MSTVPSSRIRIAVVGIALLVLGPACASRPAAVTPARTNGPAPTAVSGPTLGPPTASPTATPAAAQPLVGGPLEPGPYRVDYVAGAIVTFDLPDSAQGWEGGGSNFLGRPPFADAPGAMLSIHQVDRVMVDPCDPEAGMHAAGQSVDELVEALVAIPVATVTGPINVDLGSITGKWLALELDEELRDCELVIYHIARPSILRAIGDGQYVEIWVLDVARERVVIESSEWPQTSDEDKAVLRALTDSLRVEAAR